MDVRRDRQGRLLANRGLGWLQARLASLPMPCPVDHPALPLVGQAAQLGRILTAMRGRRSVLQVMAGRHLTPELLRDAALQILNGARDPGRLSLLQAAAASDPLSQLAHEELAQDISLPLPSRLAFTADLDCQAALPRADARTVLTIVMQTRLGQDLADVHARLQTLLRQSVLLGDTAALGHSVAAMILIDPDFDASDHVAHLMKAQCPDGSFGWTLDSSTREQTLIQGGTPTLAVIHALHALTWRRPCAPLPAPPRLTPFRAAMVHVARKLADNPPAQVTPELIAALMRASISDLPAPTGHRGIPDRLEAACFGDATTAQHFRALARDSATPEGAWMTGCPTPLTERFPDAMLEKWIRTADDEDERGFLQMATHARRYLQRPTDPRLGQAARRVAARALTRA
ncbi:hypothetical protein Q4511_06870, partial [Paracoccus sp. 1_MG-2023]